MTQPSANANDPKRDYYNLHTSGVGYLRRAHLVPGSGPKSSRPLSCTIAALVGPSHNAAFRFFDVNAAGEETKELLRSYIGHDDRKGSPLIKFRLGDLWGRTFMREGQPNAEPEPGAAVKARLIKADVIDMQELAEINQHEIITHGVGWLNRVEQVLPDTGDAFVSCCIAALSGKKTEPTRRYLEAIATTPSAEHLLRRCIRAVGARDRVFISFDLSDLKIRAYLRTHRANDDEADCEDRSQHERVGYNLKANLTLMKSISINGVKVFPVPTATAEASAASDPIGEDRATSEPEFAESDAFPPEP